MLFCMTRMAVITTMMEKTPTSTPSNVSAERNLCAASALIAIRKLSLISARRIRLEADERNAALTTSLSLNRNVEHSKEPAWSGAAPKSMRPPRDGGCFSLSWGRGPG